MSDRELMKQALEALKKCRYRSLADEIVDPAITALRERLAQPEQGPVNKYCCHSCFNKSGQVFLDRMILCPECGNKRCPKASHHDLPCTTSNEPGQPGSVYTAPQPEPEPVAWLDGPHLVVRLDMRNRLNYQGPWVDLGRAIPDKWTPFLYTTPPQRKPEQESVAWTLLLTDKHAGLVGKAGEKFVGAPDYYQRVNVYTVPPQRKPLTDNELADLWYKQSLDWMEFGRAVQAAHGIKENT